MIETTTRWAELDDAGEIAGIHVRAWQQAYRGLIPQAILDAQNVDTRTASWRRWITASLAGTPTDDDLTHRIVVAETDGRIVGWASFGAGRDPGTRHLGELAGLYVDPGNWSTGAGHALIRRAEAELIAAGYAEAYLWVLAGNERAIRFYERHGWAADGAEKYGDAGGATGLHELRHSVSLA